MNSRKYTGGKSVAEIQAMRGKESLSNYKVQPQQCLNPKCFKICKGHVFLKNHVMSKKQPKKCLEFYSNANFLEELKTNARAEIRFRRQVLKQTLLQKHLQTAKYDAIKQMATKLKIKIEQVKLAMQSGSVENGNTTMEILKQKNRADVLSMFYFENDEERMMVDSMLSQANVIIGVTNKIGKITGE